MLFLQPWESIKLAIVLVAKHRCRCASTHPSLLLSMLLCLVSNVSGNYFRTVCNVCQAHYCYTRISRMAGIRRGSQIERVLIARISLQFSILVGRAYQLRIV